MSEKYLKVEIKSEADLPKDRKNKYWVKYLKSNRMYFNKPSKIWIINDAEFYLLPLPDAEITEEMIEKRFPINVSMIRPCNLSTRNKWIWQGIKWYQRNHNRPNLPEIPNDEIQEA
jgi:hypothetical protein